MANGAAANCQLYGVNTMMVRCYSVLVVLEFAWAKSREVMVSIEAVECVWSTPCIACK